VEQLVDAFSRDLSVESRIGGNTRLAIGPICPFTTSLQHGRGIRTVKTPPTSQINRLTCCIAARTVEPPSLARQPCLRSQCSCGCLSRGKTPGDDTTRPSTPELWRRFPHARLRGSRATTGPRQTPRTKLGLADKKAAAGVHVRHRAACQRVANIKLTTNQFSEAGFPPLVGRPEERIVPIGKQALNGTTR